MRIECYVWESAKGVDAVTFKLAFGHPFLKIGCGGEGKVEYFIIIAWLVPQKNSLKLVLDFGFKRLHFFTKLGKLCMQEKMRPEIFENGKSEIIGYNVAKNTIYSDLKYRQDFLYIYYT